ncbi:MAG: tRNA uridine-5-carboxymethylaminomethyl(34) synthesis GTPase MnmE [Armatimonadota bacterium]
MSAYAPDTIVAIATPLGNAAIGVIRISGPDALAVAERLFVPLSGRSVHQLKPRTAHLGRIIESDSGDTVDTCMLTVFRSPRSFTGEDMVELSCHGGALLLRHVLSLCLKAGARLAQPGEFTKRAFLNGKIDLSQAEAVMDAISAQTTASLKIAVAQLEGRLAQRLSPIRRSLLDILSRIEASIDFPDDVDEPDPQQLQAELNSALSQIDLLLATAETGRIYRDGVAVVLAGKPNVGKSSLLNALLRDSRAIVTDIPGTTRDVIAESMNLRGIPIRLLDTAGLRPAKDPVEVVGVERARSSLRDADLVVFVMDRSTPLEQGDVAAWREVQGKRLVIAANKSDLAPSWSEADLRAFLAIPDTIPVVGTCALSPAGVPALEDAMFSAILGSSISPNEVHVSNVRHRTALEAARSSLLEAVETLSAGLPLDLLASDIREAAEAIARVTGESVSEEVIEAIFSRFCVGK